MKRAKLLGRLQRRQRAWDALFGDRHGFKRPGSFKKPFPKARRR